MTDSCYVWIWLPEATEPVVAGQITRRPADAVRTEDTFVFNYGVSYLARPDSIPIFTDLPLERGAQEPLPGLEIAGSLLDATPDSWGRRVVHEKVIGHRSRDSESAELDLLTYMLESGSDRIGALDFQTSPREYQHRGGPAASLNDLLRASDMLEAGEPLPPSLANALALGTSVGGARPKALIQDGDRHFIAKFPSKTDTISVVKTEAVAMELARRVGIDAANTTLERVDGQNVLLVERFDRGVRGTRRAMVSALTLFELRPESARGAMSYTNLTDHIRAKFTDSPQALCELFRRMVFNVIVRNTDDHARNHAAFWDGKYLTLTPAYDISPTIATRRDADVTHPMALARDGDNRSRLTTCVKAAPEFGLSQVQAQDIIDHQLDIVRSQWDDAADMAELPERLRTLMWGTQILNNAIFWED